MLNFVLIYTAQTLVRTIENQIIQLNIRPFEEGISWADTCVARARRQSNPICTIGNVLQLT